MVSGVGQGMGVLDEGGDRRKGTGNFVGEFGRPIVTIGDFGTRLFPNYFAQDLLLLLLLYLRPR